MQELSLQDLEIMRRNREAAEAQISKELVRKREQVELEKEQERLKREKRQIRVMETH